MMELNWKIGDKLKCLDNVGVESYLSKNKIYNFLKITELNFIDDDCSMIDVTNSNSQLIRGVYSYRFINIREQRLAKINKINNGTT